jgi:hypothetical protein
MDYEYRLGGEERGHQHGANPLLEAMPAEDCCERQKGQAEQCRHDPPSQGLIAQQGDANGYDDLP